MKYNFNAYDTVIALILTQYLKTKDYKAELGKVVNGREINGPELAKLLDSAAAWASSTLITNPDQLTGQVIEAVKLALEDFSGERYVQSMDAGFAEFLDDFLNDRTK